MPFYEYECSTCKYYTEVLQKLSDAPLRKCPSCGKNTFKKLVSAPVFRLKGSGWYETDFKGDKDKQRNLAGAERDESKPVDDKKGADSKAEPAKAEKPASGSDKSADKPAEKSADKSTDKSADKPAAKPTAESKPAARSRRGAPPPRARAAPARAAPARAKKKTRR